MSYLNIPKIFKLTSVFSAVTLHSDDVTTQLNVESEVTLAITVNVVV